ncbi:MAG: guanylate kinase [Candidatus Muproteobacteria bacterium RBG_16_60_9]|uniref:Guanylate kinase n=1 Tax=Candidatus Muproteobacteria bacterium RBG_16_60_9 TaxID=1817755 RepID=A0A1F6VLB9_9PROT|nr:MAG: guanylate kinase [Candidatus Muproteobacteria bacterium RBG_16_60_9]
MHKNNLFILSAASGTGKTSLAQALVDRLPDVVLSISHTTRAPRPGEKHGEHYYFVTPAEFQAMVDRGEFLEHAEVFGNRYGTARAAVEKLLTQGRRVIFDIDWQGARAIKRVWPQARSIFLLPPSRAALEQRLQGRRQDRPDVIARRMQAAVDEMRHHSEFDFVVVNDDFDHAFADLEAIFGDKPETRRPLSLDTAALLKT